MRDKRSAGGFIARWAFFILFAAEFDTAFSLARLAHDHRSRLVFAQLEASANSKTTWEKHHEALYKVKLGFDIQEMRTSDGLTMMFDKKRNVLRLDPGISPVHGVAWGRYDDRISKTGWSELYLETTNHPLVSNDVRIYSAGYIEGVLTAVRISEFNANTRHLLLRKDASSQSLTAVRQLFKKQLEFLKKKTGVDNLRMAEEPADPYDKQIRYMFFQLWGLCDGYNELAKFFNVHDLSLEDLLLLNAGGELPQLMSAYSPAAVSSRDAARPSFLQMHALRGKSRAEQVRINDTSVDPLDDAHWEQRVVSSGRCSALVRVTEMNHDVFMGHATWDDYSKMTRVFKYYKIFLDGADTIANHIAFSSYPGALSSTDDFYITDSGLSIMETSLIVLRPEAWDTITTLPYTPNFMHLMATTRLANGAANWVQLLTGMNSGTYTSQWMVMDYNQFVPNQPIPDNAFWVAEMVPGAVQAMDMSAYLRTHRYWPSYNRPYFPETRNAAGYQAAEASHGALYSWGSNPRAKIFASHYKDVNALSEMRILMDRNAYPSPGTVSAGHEIMARMDLDPAVKEPNGGIDAKVVGRCLMKSLGVQAISGPSHESLGPFRWTKEDKTEAWPGFPHIGLPEVWNFEYVQMNPTGQGPIQDVGEC